MCVLVLISGIWFNPCMVQVVELSPYRSGGCLIRVVGNARSVDTPCEEVVAILNGDN